ncbi:MAG: phytochrome sensor protein [Burkholderiales bacterium RIFCSPLOWO2_02_FULL_57_36]|nr:MAG: phytochrome sensor protein [Burkholderiales bacterium RIFCSPLOWO2_02_FULL_57_36]
MTAIVVLLTIATLYFGRDIFIPFTLAILLSFLLAPLVNGLRHIRIPRAPAVILVVTFAFSVLAGISVLVGSQLVNLANNLPSYQQTMQEKIRAIRAAAPGGGALDRTTEVVQALGEELAASTGNPADSRTVAKKKKQEPLSVRIERGNGSTYETARSLITPLLGPLGTAGIVVVFIIFVLLQPSDLRDRFIRLAGGDLHRTTEGINDAAARVSRYLLMQLIVNASYGIPVGIGLYFIGVPGAFLWALLATLLRFIPYLGPFMAALFPLVLAFAVEPGWNMFLWTLALVLTLELISNNLIEPWLYGSSTGLTPVAVILSAIFWTLLWGPVGLIMATPLTVCLVVLGRYVPQLKFLDVLLGSEPVLTPEERLYQRLLTGNVEEAIEIAEGEVQENSLLEFYDNVGLATLRLAESELERSVFVGERGKISDGMRAVIDDLRQQAGKMENESSEARAGQWRGALTLCIAGRGELDGVAATMLAHGLESRGIDARLVPASALGLDSIGNLDLVGVEVVCVSYLNPQPQTYARFVCRRLKRRAPHLKIVLGVWNLAADALPPTEFASAVGADAAVATVTDAVRQVEEMIGRADVPAMVPPPIPADEQERLDALYGSGALDARSRGKFDQVARKLAGAFDVPIALVSLIDEHSQLWRGAAGLPEELEKTRKGMREHSICGHVVASGASLVVEDTMRDPRFAGNPFLREHGIRFYAGTPLKTASGHVIGTLCILDRKPRTVNDRDLKLLQVIADELMTEVEQHEIIQRREHPDAEQSKRKYPSVKPKPAAAS